MRPLSLQKRVLYIFGVIIPKKGGKNERTFTLAYEGNKTIGAKIKMGQRSIPDSRLCSCKLGWHFEVGRFYCEIGPAAPKKRNS